MLVQIAGRILPPDPPILTGAQGIYGCRPRRCSASIRQSPEPCGWPDDLGRLAADIRGRTRPIAAKDYWTASRFKAWLTREVFNAVYVDRMRTQDQDPLEPLMQALENGDSLIIFPEGTRHPTVSPRPSRRASTIWQRPTRMSSSSRHGSDNAAAGAAQGEVVPMLCSVTFGAPMAVGEDEDKADFPRARGKR